MFLQRKYKIWTSTYKEKVKCLIISKEERAVFMVTAPGMWAANSFGNM